MTDEELTRTIATEVMGWFFADGWWCIRPENFPHTYTDHLYHVDDWNPLHDMNHAWQVVERMRELGFVLKLEHANTVQGILTWAKFSKESYDNYYHHIQPGKAICKAALEAVRGGKDDD